MSRIDQRTFCEREYPRLVGAVVLCCGDLEVATDVAHEALARVCSRWTRVAAMEAPGAYAHRIAINVLRRQQRRATTERDVTAYQPASDAAADGVDLDGALDLRAALATLPPRQQLALVCRYYSDLTVSDTAAAMRCRPGTVKSLTHQGITRLRDLLQIADPDDQGAVR